jgi:hypothetical protein
MRIINSVGVQSMKKGEQSGVRETERVSEEGIQGPKKAAISTKENNMDVAGKMFMKMGGGGRVHWSWRWGSRGHGGRGGAVYGDAEACRGCVGDSGYGDTWR